MRGLIQLSRNNFVICFRQRPSRFAISARGRSGEFVAVLSGLKSKEQVASKGSFVLTSEQKKGELQGHKD